MTSFPGNFFMGLFGYAHYPLLMLEEEVSQNLYFSNKIPPYDQENMKITVWIWKINHQY